MLELKTESTDMLSSLDTLSTMYTTNDATSRRQLKTTIEQRGIDTNRKFLHAADVVLQVLTSTTTTCTPPALTLAARTTHASHPGTGRRGE